MISEKTLRRWRKDALKSAAIASPTDPLEKIIYEYSERILRLTQELLDQHLIRKG